MRLRPAVVAVLLLVCPSLAWAQAPSSQPVEVNLLAIGDFGYPGEGQAKVAGAMVKLSVALSGEHKPPQAVLLLGDNFYTTMPKGAADGDFQKLFENIYDKKLLNMPFYVALGNHDYEYKKDIAELDYARQNPTSRWKLPARYYAVDFPAENPTVRLLVLDSNYAVMPADDWAKQLEWMKAELAKPRTAKWLICMAHHPLYSSAKHGDNARLIQDWLPLFDQAKVDSYLAGHDHTLQHLQEPGHPTSFVISGAGGAPVYEVKPRADMLFGVGKWGFLYLNFTQDRARAWFLATDGKPMRSFSRDLAGKISVDAPASQPVR